MVSCEAAHHNAHQCVSGDLLCAVDPWVPQAAEPSIAAEDGEDPEGVDSSKTGSRAAEISSAEEINGEPVAAVNRPRGANGNSRSRGTSKDGACGIKDPIKDGAITKEASEVEDR